jgi:hypothetical protein
MGIIPCLRWYTSDNWNVPGKIYQVIDMANFLLVDHVREELKTCLNQAGIN